MTFQTELWRADAQRLISDAWVARALDITAGYVPKLRAAGWLPRRSKVEYIGQAGSKGIERYRFIELVAAEVARVSKAEFGLLPAALRRLVEVIRGGDQEEVRTSLLVQVRARDFPGKSVIEFWPPEELARKGAWLEAELARPLDTPWKDRKVLNVTPLLDVVEAVAGKLYDRMVRAGFEFGGVATHAKPRRKKH